MGLLGKLRGEGAGALVGYASPFSPESGYGGRSSRLRVVVADADPDYRLRVRDHLHGSGVRVVAEAGAASEAVQLAAYYSPDVVLLDTTLPGLEVVHVIRRMTAGSEIRVVLHSNDGDDAGLLLAALRAGAVGLVQKAVDTSSLAHVLTRAAAGEAVIPRRLGMCVIDGLREMPTQGWRPVRSQLTNREWEIVDMLEEGASTRDIADRLFLTQATVYSHVKNLRRKLNARSRADVLDAARRLRPLETDG